MSDVFMPKGTGANTVADQYITHDPAPIPTATDPAQSSARVLVQQMLDQWGLGSLAGFAWDLITKDASPDEVAYQVRQTAQYATASPATCSA
jgi:hypothetical protein